MITDYGAERIFATLSLAKPNLEKVKIWSTALKDDELIQTQTGDLYDHECGGMCVLAVAFATFMPEDWQSYISGNTDAARFNKSWDFALGDIFETEDKIFASMPFWAANDDGASLTEIADVLDRYVASKV